MSAGRAQTPSQNQRGGGGSNSMLLELVDRILDKGIVIDAWARVSVLSIELLTVEARVVVASAETYLRYAEAIGDTALASMPHPQAAQQPRAATTSGVQQTGAQQTGVQPPAQPQQAQPRQALPQPEQNNMMPPQQTQQPPQQAPQQTQQPPQQGQP